MSVLTLQVLSLNKAYQPIGFISVKNAIEAVFKERAEIVEKEESGYFESYDINSWMELSLLKKMIIEEGEETVTSLWVNREEPAFLVPRVIRYLNYSKAHSQKIKFSRKNIMIRDGFTCIYCNKKFPIEELQLEHIIPKSRGGRTTWKNTAIACRSCNAKKANKTPEEAGMKLSWKPFKPKFLPKKYPFADDGRHEFWEQFLSEIYWNTTLKE
ncbi:MAG: HNH endonuclease [Promethearchaeia archaeon]